MKPPAGSSMFSIMSFLLQMSFSGRLSGGGGSSNDQDNAVVPISISSHLEDDRLSLPIHNQVLISRTVQDGQKHIVVEVSNMLDACPHLLQ